MSSKEKALLAIDIGTTKVCCIVATQEGDGPMKARGVGIAPSTGLSRGRVINVPETINAIKIAVDMASDKSEYEIDSAFIGIAGDHVRCHKTSGSVAIRNGVVTQQDIDRVMKVAMLGKHPENSEVLAKIPLEYKLDDVTGIANPIDMGGTKLAVLVNFITVDLNCLHNLCYCVSTAGVGISDIFLESVASAEAVLSPSEAQQGVALLDIGGGTCDMAIYINGAVYHVFELPMAGDALSQALASKLNISLKSAENLKLSHGCCYEKACLGHSYQDTDVYGLDIVLTSLDEAGTITIPKEEVTSILNQHVTEILEYVNADIVRNGYDAYVRNVVLTGGTSLLPGLPELAQEIMGRSVRVGYPSFSGAFDGDLDNPIFSTSMGLILCGHKKLSYMTGSQSVNLGAFGKAFQAVKSLFS